jgi:hypothetical protein
MKKILTERFIIGMAFGIIVGLSSSMAPGGEPLQYAVVGGLVGGCVGVLFTKKALTWFLEVIGKWV